MLGFSRASYYHKINGKYEWTLPELIKLCELGRSVGHDQIEIRVGEKDYLIRIVEKSSERELNKPEI